VKYLRSPFWYAFVLSFVPSLASADEPSLVDWAQRRVEDGLVKPLASKEGSRFSRSRPAPRERRVRVVQSTVSLDKRGRPFVPFAIDVRFGSEWSENDIVGCVYRSSGELFVKRGDQYRPAAFLLGKKVDPVAGVCEAAPPRS
jgi:hypothetical protein